MKIFLSICN